MAALSAAEMAVQGRDVPWLLAQWAEKTPDKAFLIWAPKGGEHRQWSYAEFDRDVRKVASGLREQGLERGDRLLIHMDNCPEYLISYFACAYLGAVAVLTNNRSVGQELAYFAEFCQVAAAVTQPQYLQMLREVAPNLKFIAVASEDACEPAGHDRGSSVIAFDDLLASQPVSRAAPDSMADLRVQFTSGTTSRPKAVLSTHANSIFAAQQTALAYGLNHDDVALMFVPLFHTNGLSVVVMSTLWVGGTIVMQRKFSVSEFWPVALQYKATWSSMPGPFFLRALYSQPVPEHHNFRFWYVAVLPEVEKHFNVKTRGHWGMTEMITLPIVSDAHHTRDSLCLGRPAPGTEIAIRRPDGSPCQPGETGRLYVKGIRGVTIFKEYLNNPEANAAAFDAEGWFDTGDLIRIDAAGNLFFAGRAKDMLRVGGENVAPSEIEKVIQGIGWVKECAVIGKPHDMLDEVPVAFVILEEGAPGAAEAKQQLIEHCQKHLADFKVIREVYVVDDLPRSTLDKIAKHKLKDWLPTPN